MKRIHISLLAAAGCLFVTGSVAAQLGSMNPFSKPNITDIFKPVVGGGASYDMQKTDKSEEPRHMEMFIVGKELVDGQAGLVDGNGPSGAQDRRNDVHEDAGHRRLSAEENGDAATGQGRHGNRHSPPMHKTSSHMKEELQKWHKVGMEPITVPAGTFLCQHWKKDSGVGDVWASDKITPMGMVKSVQEHETMVLVKVISGATDHITGPVTKFDPQMMRQQMMEKMQQQKKTAESVGCACRSG